MYVHTQRLSHHKGSCICTILVLLLIDSMLSSCPCMRQTGPMHKLYNLNLRASLRPTTSATGWQPRFRTTLHVVNSCILKLSQLSKSSRVYLGVNGGKGGKLPTELLYENKDKVGSFTGFVEPAFLSATASESERPFGPLGDHCAYHPSGLLLHRCGDRIPPIQWWRATRPPTRWASPRRCSHCTARLITWAHRCETSHSSLRR